MISCKKATELISKRMDEPLSFKEEVSLKLHLFICEFCEKFSQQAGLIRKALRLSTDESEPEDLETCSSELSKKRLKEKIKEKLSE